MCLETNRRPSMDTSERENMPTPTRQIAQKRSCGDFRRDAGDTRTTEPAAAAHAKASLRSAMSRSSWRQGRDMLGAKRSKNIAREDGKTSLFSALLYSMCATALHTTHCHSAIVNVWATSSVGGGRQCPGAPAWGPTTATKVSQPSAAPLVPGQINQPYIGVGALRGRFGHLASKPDFCQEGHHVAQGAASDDARPHGKLPGV